MYQSIECRVEVLDQEANLTLRMTMICLQAAPLSLSLGMLGSSSGCTRLVSDSDSVVRLLESTLIWPVWPVTFHS